MAKIQLINKELDLHPDLKRIIEGIPPFKLHEGEKIVYDYTNFPLMFGEIGTELERDILFEIARKLNACLQFDPSTSQVVFLGGKPWRRKSNKEWLTQI